MGKADRPSAPRLDAANLAGITSLMNPQNVRAGVDLSAVEKSVMGQTQKPQRPEIDQDAMINAELKQLTDEIGIDFEDVGAPTPTVEQKGPPDSRPAPAFAAPATSVAVDDFDLDALIAEAPAPKPARSAPPQRAPERAPERYSSTPARAPAAAPAEPPDDDSESSSGSSSDGEGDEEDTAPGADDDVDGLLAKVEEEFGFGADTRRDASLKNIAIPGRGAPPPAARPSEEQERRAHISEILGSVHEQARTATGAERSRVLDYKASLLEQIGHLRQTLEEEGIGTEMVPAVTMESSVEEIESTRNMLQLKNDRNRCSTLAEEVILGGAEVLESVLDGTRAIPLLGLKPDYTNYHNTVNVKLHRMRHETAQIVRGIVDKYKIGPTARMVMELLPSLFLYPRQQRKQRGTSGLHDDPNIVGPRVGNVGTAMAAIRDADERNNYHALADI
ncbi:MAG: hypothetical protein KGL39_10860 [Patescibacteria group bacterium]|nr:hypothetical protein [Patescibacteria group bacterium]